MKFQRVIQRNRETIYSLLTDLSGYKSWLPGSEMYSEIGEISESPVKVGTTYVDQGTRTRMEGRVTELEPGKSIGFEQSLGRKIVGMESGLKIRVRYTLEASGEFGTQVTRELSLRGKGIFWALQPVLLGPIKKENERIMERLKWYLEAR